MAKTTKQIQAKDIGLKIKRARQEANMSQDAFAKKLGISGAYLGYLEAGKRTLKVTMLEKIAEITDKPFDYFMGREEHLPHGEITKKLNQIMSNILDIRKRGVGGTAKAIMPIEPILDLTPHAVLVIDQKTNRCIYANTMWEKITTFKRKDVVGKSIDEFLRFLSPETIKAVKKARKEIERSDKFIDVKGTALTRKGKKMPVVITEKAIRNASGKLIARLALLWTGDLTYYEKYRERFRG
jgi:PAS domain S-box-containing protein